jgi:hypothetical protein
MALRKKTVSQLRRLTVRGVSRVARVKKKSGARVAETSEAAASGGGAVAVTTVAVDG